MISIIIPVYNRDNIVTYPLDSITRQSYRNWECIIVDDGSTDKTVEMAFTPMSVSIRLEDEIDVSRGDVIVHVDHIPHCSN